MLHSSKSTSAAEPLLAKLSAKELVALELKIKDTLGKAFKHYLMSKMISKLSKLPTPSPSTHETATFESLTTTISLSARFDLDTQSLQAFRIAIILADLDLLIPTWHKNSHKSLPHEFLKTPPMPTRPGQPFAAPSTLNLRTSRAGGIHSSS